MTAIRSRLAQDSGASLVLVMGLLLLVGLVVIATLTYTSTSITASADITSNTESMDDVDGALQAGVNQLRMTDITGRALPGGGSGPCPALVVPGPGPGRDVAVTCETLPGSGGLSRAIERSLPHAMLTTGTGAASETGLDASAGANLLVSGAVAANTSITARNGAQLTATGAVTAVRGCRGIVEGASRDCSSSPATVADLRQPTSGFVRRSVPTCPGSGRTVTFKPGFYDDAQALNALMSSCTGSTFWFPGIRGGAVYYFDFHNGEPGRPDGSRVWTISDKRVRVVGGGTSDPGKPSTVTIPGSCVSPQVATDNKGVTFVFGGDSRWEVTAGRVELCGPGDARAKAAPVAILGADRNLGDGGPGQAGPATAPTGLSNDSPGMLRMRPGGATDVSATTPGDATGSTKPRAAGSRIINRGAAPVGAASPGATPLPASGRTRPDRTAPGRGAGKPVAADPVVPFGTSAADRELIADWDSRAATAIIDGTLSPGGQQGMVRIDGFAPADAAPSATVPRGATLTFAKLYVRHREARIKRGKDPVAFLQAQVTPSRSGATRVGPIAGDGRSTPGLGVNPDDQRKDYRVDTVDLLATPALQKEVSEHGFTGASVTWLVQSQEGLDLQADLDTVQLAIGWTSPRDLRTQSTLVDGTNCLTNPPAAYPGAGACALLSTSSASGPTRFHVQGAGFAPLAAFDLRHEDVAAPVFTSGLVGRHLSVALRARSGYGGPLISSPEPLTTLLRAYTCTQGPGKCPRPGDETTLSAPWDLVGRAKITLADPGPIIQPGNRAVRVLSWSLRPGH